MHKNSGFVLQMMNSVSATNSGWPISFRELFFPDTHMEHTHTHTHTHTCTGTYGKVRRFYMLQQAIHLRKLPLELRTFLSLFFGFIWQLTCTAFIVMSINLAKIDLTLGKITIQQVTF